MKDILVFSRHAIEAAPACEVPHLIVSINCPGDEPARIRTNRATLGRVNLFFWDLDRVPEPGALVVISHDSEAKSSSITEDQLCQPADAANVIDLVDAHPEAERIIVHCTAGKSRSAAVAAALHRVLNGTDELIFGNKWYTPNMRVYRMVLEEWYARHPLE